MKSRKSDGATRQQGCGQEPSLGYCQCSYSEWASSLKSQKQTKKQRKDTWRDHLSPPPRPAAHADTHLSMMPFMRMALFQSFRVDLPARCTNSFGLITCSSYCGGSTAETGQHGPL